MDEKELRELLRERLHVELQIFKDSLLQREKEDIFRASYATEIYVNLYEIFAVHTDSLQCDIIRKLLNLRFGILEAVYQGWLGKEDSFYDELRTYACRELENISEVNISDCGKECWDGEGTDQAA